MSANRNVSAGFDANSGDAFTMDLNYGYADFGDLPANADVPLLDGSSSATLTGEETGGVITGGNIAPITNVLRPAPGVTMTVTLTRDPGTPITGTYDSGSGATTLNAAFDSSSSWRALVRLTAPATTTTSPTPWTRQIPCRTPASRSTIRAASRATARSQGSADSLPAPVLPRPVRSWTEPWT